MGADDHCYERADLINNSARPCKALEGPCETSSEQYFKRAVLGVDRVPIVSVTRQVREIEEEFEGEVKEEQQREEE